MAGEVDQLVGAVDRVKRCEDELKRTSDVRERGVLKARLSEALAERADAVSALKRAREAGESEAVEFFKLLGI
jgi:hypothetical protein